MPIDPRILQLLQQVGRMPAAGPGITPIAPTLAPAGPTPSAPAQPGQAPQNPNFMQRFGNFMVPGGQGLLTPEEQQQLGQQGLLSMGLGLLEAGGPSVQPVSLGQALNRAYQGAAPQMQQLASGLVQSRRMQDMERQRKAIFEKYPERPGESTQETGQRYLRMLNEFMRIGDTETVARLSELLKSMGLGDQTRAGRNPFTYTVVGPDGKPHLYERTPDGDRDLGVAKDANTGAADARDDQANQRRFQRGATLGAQYRQWITPWIAGKQAIERAVQFRRAALNGNGPAQIQFIYAFIATLDNSVVREGEARLLAEGSSLASRAEQQVDKIQQGQVMPRAVVQQMADILDQVRGDVSTRFDRMRNTFIRAGKAWGVGDEFFPNMNEVMEATPLDDGLVDTGTDEDSLPPPLVGGQ